MDSNDVPALLGKRIEQDGGIWDVPLTLCLSVCRSVFLSCSLYLSLRSTIQHTADSLRTIKQWERRSKSLPFHATMLMGSTTATVLGENVSTIGNKGSGTQVETEMCTCGRERSAEVDVGGIWYPSVCTFITVWLLRRATDIQI